MFPFQLVSKSSLVIVVVPEHVRYTDVERWLYEQCTIIVPGVDFINMYLYKKYNIKIIINSHSNKVY